MHAYPHNLVAQLHQHWDKPPATESIFTPPPYTESDPLPPDPVLTQLLSTCYQASLLQEEGRPVRFRLISIDPQRTGQEAAGRGRELSRHVLARPFPFEANELRRLAPAVDFERAMIGVRLNPQKTLEIWGLVHSGRRWVEVLEGSRRSLQQLPAALVVGVAGPGHLAVCKGSFLVLRMKAGRLSLPSPGLIGFQDRHADNIAHGVLNGLHEQARRERGSHWAQLDPQLLDLLRTCTALRLISATRKLQHGGTLLFLPQRIVRKPDALTQYLRIKYLLSPSETARHLYLNTVQLMNALAEATGRMFGPAHVAGWGDYLASNDPAVVEADEILTENAHLVAGMSSVDGAVVLGIPLELIGFGAEISGALPPVDYVVRVTDDRRGKRELEPTSGVGTRHRSAYRLCQALPQAVAVVVSQDGGVRLVRRFRGRVTYWDQPSFGTMTF